MTTLKIWEAIEINEDKEFQYYVSNNVAYSGKIKILLDKVENFMTAVKGGKITPEKWEARIVVEENKYSDEVSTVKYQ